jgi:hypothetical protein
MNDCTNTGFIPRTKVTLEYGELKLAQTFVRRQWEPADENTRVGLQEFAKALGVVPVKSTSQKKVVRCLSDLCVAVRRSPDGLIAWQTGSAELIGLPYGQEIAMQVKKGLEYNGLINIEQKSAKSKELARIYQVDRSIWSSDYKFKQHKDWHPVEVRGPKTKVGGKTTGGSPMGRARKYIQSMIQEVRSVVVMNLPEPPPSYCTLRWKMEIFCWQATDTVAKPPSSIGRTVNDEGPFLFMNNVFMLEKLLEIRFRRVVGQEPRLTLRITAIDSKKVEL